MKTDEESYWRAGWKPVVACWLVAAVCGVMGLLVALLEMLSSSNIDGEQWEHVAIVWVGWVFALGCFGAAWVLVGWPSWRRLWVLVPCGILFGVWWWLAGLPATAHLMH